MSVAKARFLMKLLNGRRNAFAADPFVQEKFDRLMARPLPDHRYAIFFTPRSGSTRVGGLLDDAKLSNRPKEYFNPNFTSAIATNHSARNLSEYIELIQRKQKVKGHFGVEITYRQLVFSFLTGQRFLNQFKPHHTAWLIREDIIAQAVSVSRLVQTRVAHTPFSDSESLKMADSKFTYNGNQIKSALMRIIWMEERTEALIKRAGLDTFRFSYEMTNALGPDRATALIADKLGLPAPSNDLIERHKKLPGKKGDGFAERFQDEHKDLVAKVARKRAPMLALIEAQKELYL